MNVRRITGAIGLLTLFPLGAIAQEPALDCENASSTNEINACVQREYEAADRVLNETYQKALASIPEMAGDPPYDPKTWEQALRASQRAWIAFRDAECGAHVPMFWSGGSGATSEVISCEIEKTQERVKELKARYEAE